jgi:hypothetical protein
LLSTVAGALALCAACSSGGGPDRSASSSTSSSSTSTTSAVSTTASAAGASAPTTCRAAPAGGGSKSGGEVNPPGDIPDDIAFVPFTSPSGRYTLRVPEGWARTDGPDDAVRFTDKLNAIDVELRPAASAATVATATDRDLSSLQATEPCFERGSVKAVSRKAGPAIVITYRADSSPDPVTGKVVHDDVERYLLWNAGTEAVIRLSGPQGSDNVDAWKLVTNSFTWG